MAKGGEITVNGEFETSIPYGQSRLVRVSPDHALRMADVLEKGAENVGGLMVDRGARGRQLAFRMANTELSASGEVAISVGQADLDAARGILGLMRAVHNLRVEPDVEASEELIAAETIFDNMRGQISGLIFSS